MMRAAVEPLGLRNTFLPGRALLWKCVRVLIDEISGTFGEVWSQMLPMVLIRVFNWSLNRNITLSVIMSQ